MSHRHRSCSDVANGGLSIVRGCYSCAGKCNKIIYFNSDRDYQDVPAKGGVRGFVNSFVELLPSRREPPSRVLVDFSSLIKCYACLAHSSVTSSMTDASGEKHCC